MARFWELNLASLDRAASLEEDTRRRTIVATGLKVAPYSRLVLTMMPNEFYETYETVQVVKESSRMRTTATAQSPRRA